MLNLNRLKISTKGALFSLVVGALVFMLCIYVWVSINALNKHMRVALDFKDGVAAMQITLKGINEAMSSGWSNSALETIDHGLAGLEQFRPEDFRKDLEEDVYVTLQKAMSQWQNEQNTLAHFLQIDEETTLEDLEETDVKLLLAIGKMLETGQQTSDHLVKLSQLIYNDTLAEGQKTIYAVTLGFLCLVLLISVSLWLLLKSITVPVGTLMHQMKDIAEGKGDLTCRLEVSGTDEIAQLASAFNLFIGKIEAIVIKIKHTSELIKRSTGEIMDGNSNMEQHAKKQAASLENTSSSIEDMTAKVKQNTDHAHQANQFATDTRKEAQGGNQVVTQAIAAMGEINESSKQIASIIGVIDEIAFQTNLLALNAAVEAARAGEQGRGFAVVATEVRNLAQRSAEAAKEIKNLIEDSVAKVETGSKLVYTSGQALSNITERVENVTDIIADIATVSEHQSDGIKQVNMAITEMDRILQENSSLVVQATAANRSIEEQTWGLMDLVSKFKVSQDQL